MSLQSGFAPYENISAIAASTVVELLRISGTTWNALVGERLASRLLVVRSIDDFGTFTEPKIWADMLQPASGGNNCLGMNGGTILAGVAYSNVSTGDFFNEIWKSVDEGATWALAQALTANAFQVHAVCFLRYLDGNWYCGTTWQGHTWKSTDDGDTWVDQGQFGAETAVWDMVDCGGGVWVAVTAGNTSSQNPVRLWRSTDSGGTWGAHVLEINNGGSSAPVDRPASLVRVVGTGTLLAIVPNGANTDSVWRSVDTGQSWVLLADTEHYGRIVEAAGGLVGGRRSTSSTGVIATFSGDDGLTFADIPNAQDGIGCKSLAAAENGDVIAGPGESGGATLGALYRAVAEAVIPPDPPAPMPPGAPAIDTSVVSRISLKVTGVYRP